MSFRLVLCGNITKTEATVTGTPDGEPFALQVNIDRASPIPLHQQISAPLEAQITSGNLLPGTLIEDEVSMAKRLNVSRPTARRSLQDLVVKGLLTRKRGVGTRVTPPRVRRSAGLTSLHDDLRKAGYSARTDVLNYQVLLASDEEAQLLECSPGTEIIRTERLRWSNDEPLAIMTNLIPAVYAPSLTTLSAGGLYEALKDAGITLATAQEKVSARNATPDESRLLGVDDGQALLTLQRTTYDPAGKVVEYGDHVYNAAVYSLTFTSSAG